MPCGHHCGDMKGTVVAEKNDWIVVQVEQAPGTEYLNPFATFRRWEVEAI